MLRRLLWIPYGFCLLVGIWMFARSVVCYPVGSRLPHFVEAGSPESTPPPASDPASCLPQILSGAELLLESLVSYEGPFPEDLSGEQTVSAGIILQNNSDRMVTFARIEGIGNGCILTFDVTCLPPGQRILVAEKNGSQFPTGPLQWRCCAVSTDAAIPWEPELTVQNTDRQSFSVTNLGAQDLTRVTVYYKQYSPQDAMYIGGITYRAVLSGLASLETRETSPYHFTQGYSRIVMIKKEQA